MQSRILYRQKMSVNGCLCNLIGIPSSKQKLTIQQYLITLLCSTSKYTIVSKKKMKRIEQNRRVTWMLDQYNTINFTKTKQNRKAPQKALLLWVLSFQNSSNSVQKHPYLKPVNVQVFLVTVTKKGHYWIWYAVFF